MRSKGSAADLEQRRHLAVQRLQEGYSLREVAQFLGVHQRSVEKWKAKYNQQGDAGLASKPALGRMPKLTDRQTQTVLSWFSKSPREFGYSTDLWTSRRVRDLIHKSFGVAFNSNYISEWLTERRVTPQKPKRQPRQRDQVRIDNWVRNDWPRLVKKGANEKPISS